MPKFRVCQTMLVVTPIATVFDYLRDFKNWPEWSPWLIADPAFAITYADGGNAYHWNGPICGEGEMAVSGETKPTEIRYRLTFLKPWKSVAHVSLRLREKPGGTEVTWVMDSALPFFMFWLKNMMITIIGMDYQRGLLMLKNRLETGRVPSRLEFPGAQHFPGFAYLGIRTTCDMADLITSVEGNLDRLNQWMKETGTAPAAKLVSIYHKWDLSQKKVTYTSAIPLTSLPAALPSGWTQGELPACETYRIVHTGAHAHLGNAWSAGITRARNNIFKQSKSMHPFESYETTLAEAPDDQQVIVVHFPLKP